MAKRRTAATALATVTATSATSSEEPDRAWAARRPRLVRSRLMANRPADTTTKRPWCRAPGMLRANSRCTAVLKRVQMARASALDPKSPTTGRQAMKRKRYPRVLITPTPAKRRSWSAATWLMAEDVEAELLRTRRRAWPCEILHTPRRSFRAVRTICTRESGSSTQSTGTSLMRRPSRSAVTRSSVSKNHSSSSINGRSCRADSRRRALNPHWASLNRPRRESRSNRL